MRADGLRLAIPERVITVRPPVVETAAELELRPDDVLLLTVKGQDAGALLPDLAALRVAGGTAGETLPIYCGQNGLANEPAALRYFANVHGMEVSLQATYLEPGKVSAARTPFTGILEIGRYPGGHDAVDDEVAEHLNASGFLTTVRDDVMAWKRAKLLRNLNNALDALCDRQPADSPEAQTLATVRAALVAEARACFDAGGLSLTDTAEFDEHKAKSWFEPVEGQSRTAGSTWQSVARGAGSVETDFLNGEITWLGRTHGVPTPTNVRVQQRMAQFIRAGERPGAVTPAELLAD
jgi:2-dehydropantoate 2-reductase